MTLALGPQGIASRSGIGGYNPAPVIVLTAPPSLTDDTTPDIVGNVTWPGHSVSGLTIDIVIDGGAPAQVTTDGSGVFTYTPSALAPGAHTIQASVTSTVTSGGSLNFTITAPDAATTAYLAAVTTAGYTPDPTWAAQIDTLIKALKAGGSPPWDNYDVLMVLAHPDKRACRGLRDPTRFLIENNAPTFTADRGYTGNASNMNCTFSPGYNPGAGGSLLTQNDIHVGVYALTQGSNGNYHFGTALSNQIRVRGRVDTNSAASLASSSGVSAIGTKAMPVHIVGIRRDGTTARIFRDGVQNNTAAIASAALSSFAWAILRTNSADYTDAQVAIVHAGRAHSDAQALQEHNAMQAYLQARGAVA